MCSIFIINQMIGQGERRTERNLWLIWVIVHGVQLYTILIPCVEDDGEQFHSLFFVAGLSRVLSNLNLNCLRNYKRIALRIHLIYSRFVEPHKIPESYHDSVSVPMRNLRCSSAIYSICGCLKRRQQPQPRN